MADLKRKITDEELKAIVDDEIAGAMGEYAGELADERTKAMDRYLGEPIGNEEDGRSEVQTRDVMEVVEWILPSLIRIFTNADRAVEIEPVGPEDEQQAEQEGDYLNHLFYKQNSGFLILYTFFKDALLQKTGIVKSYAEENERQTKETYSNLNDEEFAYLLADDELEIVEHSTGEAVDMATGMPIAVHDATFMRTDKDIRICVDNLPPEEFLISRDARSPNPKKARFLAHRTRKTVSELFEMGFTEAEILTMDHGISEIDFSEEAIARRHLDDEAQWSEADLANFSQRQVKVNECYVRCDKNGDGISELLKVFRSGDFIQWEEVDSSYIAAVTPNILTHKFFGLSVADMLMDLQEIRTGLLRSYMDNVYQTVNGETFYDEDRVNVDDLLTSTPWGLRAVKGSPHDAVLKMKPDGLPPQAFTLFELTDGLKNQRIGDFQSQLDPDVLQNANTGVVINMLQEARAKVEMIARIFAETGVKELFRDLHELARKNMDRETRFKLRNSWVPVNPSEWRERVNFTVTVGLGTRSQQEQIAHLTTLHQMQLASAQLGMVNITPANVHNTFIELAEAMGHHMPEKFSTDPQQTQAMIQWLMQFMPQADPNAGQLEALKQIEAGKREMEFLKTKAEAEDKMRRAQIDVQKVALESRKVEIDAGLKAEKNQLDELKLQIQAMKERDDMTMEAQKSALEQMRAQMSQHLEKLALLLQQRQHEDKLALEQYKTEVQAAVASQKPEGDGRMLAMLMDSIMELKDEMAKPKAIAIQRDKNGNILSVNGQKVKRDENGRLAGIE